LGIGPYPVVWALESFSGALAGSRRTWIPRFGGKSALLLIVCRYRLDPDKKVVPRDANRTGPTPPTTLVKAIFGEVYDP